MTKDQVKTVLGWIPIQPDRQRALAADHGKISAVHKGTAGT
jgi:hypothetical protein